MDERRLLFSGSVVSNGGDRAIVEAQAALLRQHDPDVQISVADSAPAVADRVLSGVRVVPPAFSALVRRDLPKPFNTPVGRVLEAEARLAARRSLRRLLPLTRGRRRFVRDFAGYDAVVYAGGTTLIESYWLRPKFFELELARDLGLPIVFMTQSLGPFRHRASQRRMRRLVGYADLVLLRDERSLRHLEEIGADTSRAHVLPDIVFSMVTDDAVARVRSATLPEGGHRLRIGVNVREIEKMGAAAYGAGKDESFLLAVAAMVEHAVRRYDADVTFISTCQGVPEYWVDDARTAQRVVDHIGPDVRGRVTVDEGYHGTDELIGILAGFDLVVSTRLHGAIFALAAGTIALPIAYEFKTHEVFRALGQGHRVLDAGRLDGPSAIAALDAFVSEADGERGEVAERLADLAAHASDAGRLAVEALATPRR